MRILAIDPGTVRIGFAILEIIDKKIGLLDYGLIDTKEILDPAEKLNSIAEDIESLAQQYKPDILAIEKLFFAKNVTTGLAVAEARGVIIQTSYKHGLRVEEIAPTQVKSGLTGHGKASKEQIQHMVMRLLKLKELPKPDDVADAIAIGLCIGLTSNAVLN